jgi:hypothetical protein
MVVEAGASPGQDEEISAALMAAQERSMVPRMAVEAGMPPVQDEETVAALMGTREASWVSQRV